MPQKCGIEDRYDQVGKCNRDVGKGQNSQGATQIEYAEEVAGITVIKNDSANQES